MLIVYAAALLSSGRVVKKMASIVSAQKYGKIEGSVKLSAHTDGC